MWTDGIMAVVMALAAVFGYARRPRDPGEDWPARLAGEGQVHVFPDFVRAQSGQRAASGAGGRSQRGHQPLDDALNHRVYHPWEGAPDGQA